MLSNILLKNKHFFTTHYNLASSPAAYNFLLLLVQAHKVFFPGSKQLSIQQDCPPGYIMKAEKYYFNT